MSDRVCQIHDSRVRGGTCSCSTIVKELRQRISELLATIVKLTNDTPYPEEVKDWIEQRGKMIAEIGTLKARVVELENTNVDSEPFLRMKDDVRAITEELLRLKAEVDVFRRRQEDGT